MSDESRGTFNKDNQIKFKTSMIRSILYDYSDTYKLSVSETIAITESGADDAAKWGDKKNKGVVSKNCVPFTACINELNNSQTDNPKDIDNAMPVENLIECTDNYSKKIRKLMATLLRWAKW